MSILTSDDSRKTSRLVRSVIRFSNLLSAISYLAGIAYFAYLVHEPDKTYFSDNGLLPGLASREFTLSAQAETYLSELENVTATLPEDTIPVEYLRQKFADELGLRFYQHSFRLNYPFGNKRKHDGKNVYAILRAPRASSTEALVISTPFRSAASIHGSNLPSVALMLALARFFTTKHYWAKDLIFLVGDKELVGMQSWLNAYHGSPNGEHMTHGRIPATSGAIQAALNLEIHTFRPKSIDVKIEGMNGQLPNLDLFNLAIELCNRESLPATFHGSSFAATSSRSKWKNFISSGKMIGSMMATQATTLPTGAHGLFQRFGIQAITLEAFPVPASKSQPPTSANNIGRSIEGIIRSLNNLQQRFYRSYWFYLLTSTRRFISIGFYMIAFGLMCLPLPLRALRCYFQSIERSGDDERNQIPANRARVSIVPQLSLWASFEAAFLAHLIGIVTLAIPVIFARVETARWAPPDLPLHDQLAAVFASIAIISLAPLVLRLRKSFRDASRQSMIALLNAALIFGGLSLVNISLALALTALYVPMIFAVKGLLNQNHDQNQNHDGIQMMIRRLLARTILLMIHPLSLHFFCLVALSVSIEQRKSSSPPIYGMLRVHFERALGSQRKTILYYIEDWFLYDNWSFMIVCLGLLPVWLQLWYDSLCRIE